MTGCLAGNARLSWPVFVFHRCFAGAVYVPRVLRHRGHEESAAAVAAASLALEQGEAGGLCLRWLR